MFGTHQQQQPQQQQQPSVFGAPQTQPQQAFGGFGQSTQQQSSNVFGGLGQQAQKPAGTGLFGGTTTAPSIFGNANANTASAQPTSTGLFGATNQTAGPSGGIFGQNNQQAGQIAPGGAGIFGQSQAQQSSQPAPGGIFGQTATTAQPASGGIFGSNPNPTQPPANNLFGASNAAPATSNQQNFGASLFGGNKPPAPTPTLGTFGANNQQPANTLGPSNSAAPTDTAVTKSTKFNDLPPQYKQILETVDAAIQKQMNISRELKSTSLGAEPEKGAKLAKQVAKTAVMTANTLNSDEAFVQDLKTKVDQSVQDTVVATRIIDGFANPHQKGSYLKVYAEFPLEFFARLARQLKERLERYKIIVEQIERKLASAVEGEHTTPQAIASTLRTQHSTFMALANKTAELDGQLQQIKEMYRTAWRAQTGSARDPFDISAMDDADSLTVSKLRMS